MISKKTTLIVSSIIALSACSKVTDVFEKEPTPAMKGERISILQLQKSLKPDTALDEGQEFTLPATWENSAWPQAGGYPNHSMQNLAFTPNEPKKIWRTSIGKGSTSNIPLTAQPIISGNVIYTLDTKSRLTAFDAKTGKKIWSVDVENENEDENVITGGISFAHNALYVTNGSDEILSVSPDNGTIIWRKRLPAPSRAAPTIINGRVFISTIDSRLVALSANDGTSLWEYTGISETTGLLGAASPSANNDIVVPVFSSGEVTALRVENGSVAWSDNLTNIKRFRGGIESLSDIKAMPILDRGMIITMSFGGKLAAIDERSGARIWSREIGGAQTPWIAGNILFVLSSDNELIALNVLNGAIFWIAQLKQFEDENDRKDVIQWNGPLMAEGRLILASSHGNIIEVSPHNGEIIRKTRTKKKVRIAPILSNGVLYVLSDDGTLTAYK